MFRFHEPLFKWSTLFILVIFTSCGSTVDEALQKSKSNSSPAEANLKINCLGEACQQESIVNIQYNHLTTCTGFLVSKNVVMTSAHCLQEVKNSKDCSRLKVYSKNPQNSKITVVSQCQEILHQTKFNASLYDKNFFQPDYALFKISQELKNKPLEYKAEGIVDLKNYHILTSEYNSVGGEISFKKITCLAHHHTLLNPETVDAKGEAIVLTNCPLQPVHLGAPIIRDDGSLAGIVTEIMPRDFIATQGIANKNYLTQIIDDAGKMMIQRYQIAIGTNANCFNEVRANIFSSDSYDCTRATGNYFQDLLILAKDQDQIDRKVMDQKVDSLLADKKMKWYYDPIKDEVLPVCVKDHDALMLIMKEERSYMDALWGTMIHNYQIPMKIFSVQGILNDKLQPQGVLTVDKTPTRLVFQIKIDAKDFLKTNLFFVEVNPGSITAHNYKLSACSN